MSEALARKGDKPAAKASAAGQLSDDIGDVLASIRRMISQDSMPRPVQRLDAGQASAAVLRLDGALMAAGGEDAPDQLARARSLSRRSDEAASPLRLGAADRVAGKTLADAGGDEPPEDGGVADGDCAGAADLGLADPAEAGPVPETSAGDTVGGAPADRAPEGEAVIPAPDEAAGPSPLGHPAARPLAGPYVQGGGDAAVIPATAAPDAPTAPSTLLPDPMPAPLMEPAMTAAPTPTDDDASIFSTMIRDMIRQELHGDPSGRMSRDLRAMVLREVALAITGQKAAAG